MKLFNLYEDIQPLESDDIFEDDIDLAFDRAIESGERDPWLESIIMKDPVRAHHYAKDVIEGRWPEAEPYIMTDFASAFWYAFDVIGGRWPEAEPIIMKDPTNAVDYAKHVIKGRWLEAEPYIRKDPSEWEIYRKAFGLFLNQLTEAPPAA